MTGDPLLDTVACTLCGRDRPIAQIRWFVPFTEGDTAEADALIMNWPETTGGDPLGVPYCADCLAKQIADVSENVIG